MRNSFLWLTVAFFTGLVCFVLGLSANLSIKTSADTETAASPLPAPSPSPSESDYYYPVYDNSTTPPGL